MALATECLRHIDAMDGRTQLEAAPGAAQKEGGGVAQNTVVRLAVGRPTAGRKGFRKPRRAFLLGRPG